MKLLGLEREVAGHDHDAEDREGVPPEGIRRAQEGKGLVGGLVQEFPDGGKGSIMDHVDHAHGWSCGTAKRVYTRQCLSIKQG